MNRQALLFILTGLCVASLASAQSTSPAPTPPGPPPGPQVVMPTNVAFEKAFVYVPTTVPEHETAAEKAYRLEVGSWPRLDKADVVKTGDTVQALHHYTNGTTMEIWERGQLIMFDDGSRPLSIRVTGPGMGAADSGLPFKPQVDFSELGWVARELYVGEQIQSSIKCYTYKDSSGRIAWVEETHKLPVRMDSASESIRYSYKVPPTEPLVLPDAYAKQLIEVHRSFAGAPR